MECELRVITGCPNTEAARALFARALALESLDATTIRLRVVSTDGQAKALDFHGSPTFVLDGQDAFSASGEPAISCRVYSNGMGLAGLPAISGLRSAIRAARD
ncbi:hypothetical protein [Arthrobacter sp. HLT1-21]